MHFYNKLKNKLEQVSFMNLRIMEISIKQKQNEKRHSQTGGSLNSSKGKEKWDRRSAQLEAYLLKRQSETPKQIKNQAQLNDGHFQDAKQKPFQNFEQKENNIPKNKNFNNHDLDKSKDGEITHQQTIFNKGYIEKQKSKNKTLASKQEFDKDESPEQKSQDQLQNKQV